MAQALASFGNPTPQEHLRRSTTGYVRRRPNEVFHAWGHKTLEASPQDCASFAKYLVAAAQPGAWAEDVELVALGKSQPCHPILVLSPGATPVAFGDRSLPLPRPETRINLWLHGGHFEFIRFPIPECVWAAVWQDVSVPDCDIPFIPGDRRWSSPRRRLRPSPHLRPSPMPMWPDCCPLLPYMLQRARRTAWH